MGARCPPPFPLPEEPYLRSVSSPLRGGQDWSTVTPAGVAGQHNTWSQTAEQPDPVTQQSSPYYNTVTAPSLQHHLSLGYVTIIT